MINLEEFYLEILHHKIQDEETRKPDYILPLVTDGPIQDPYIRILHHLTTLPSLTVLRLTGPLVISPNIFSNLPAFPSLLDFQLDFATETADGDWFFLRDEEFYQEIAEQSSGSEEIHSNSYYNRDSDNDSIYSTDSTDSSPRVRKAHDPEGPWFQDIHTSNPILTVPSPTVIPPLFLSAARFILSSPTLRTFLLRHKNGPGEEYPVYWPWTDMDRHLEVWFVRRGRPRGHFGFPDRIGRVKVEADRRFVGANRVYWRTRGANTKMWRPEGEVMEAWREVCGNGGSMFWLDEEKFEKNHFWPEYRGDLVDEEEVVEGA